MAGLLDKFLQGGQGLLHTGQRPGIERLALSPQEQGLWQHHLGNLGNMGSGGVRNQDGSISTVRQAVVTGPDGKFYSIPTVWGGKVLSERDAISRAAEIGWDKWPSFASPQSADARYQQMHRFME